MAVQIRQPGFQYMALDDFEELLADKPENERWELIGGRVVKPMVGVRWEHNFLIQNISTAVRERLRSKGSSCRTLTETFYLKDPAIDAAMLPDVIVQCGPLPPGATSIKTPVVVIEVLSGGTEARDRLIKWQVYQKVETLMHYVLVDQHRAHIESFDRIDGDWRGMQIVDGVENALPLSALDLAIPLAEIYRDVLSD